METIKIKTVYPNFIQDYIDSIYKAIGIIKSNYEEKTDMALRYGDESAVIALKESYLREINIYTEQLSKIDLIYGKQVIFVNDSNVINI